MGVHRRFWGAAAISLVTAPLVACSTATAPITDVPTASATASVASPDTTPPSPRATRSLPPEYLAAVADAANPGPEDFDSNLVSLTPGTPGLVFTPDGSEVAMVTVTDWTGYAQYVGQPMQITRETWLTPYPQVQDLCRNYVATTGADPSQRILQYLGMPPDDKPLTVATMLVPLADMFRPTPEPQIDTAGVTLDDPAALPPDVRFPNHADWFRLQKTLAYDPANPYPWTGLGYTYDWGNPANKFGASEFIVRPGSTVDVLAAQTPAEYCAPQ